MKILTDFKELEGKTIAFAHGAQFADQITLATTDKEVLMATFDIDEFGERKEIRVLNPLYVKNTLEKESYLREALAKREIFDLEKYKEEEKAKRLAEKERFEIEKKERDLKLLADLKAKYETDEAK